MENEMQVFSSEQFGNVRVVERDGEPWFVAADVCKALEIGNPSQALVRLEDDEKFTTLVSNDGAVSGTSSMAFVSESGFYSLILGSRKPKAKAFRRWIIHEVIPSVHKHDAYLTPGVLEQAIANPDFMIGLFTALKSENCGYFPKTGNKSEAVYWPFKSVQPKATI